MSTEGNSVCAFIISIYCHLSSSSHDTRATAASSAACLDQSGGGAGEGKEVQLRDMVKETFSCKTTLTGINQYQC